MSTRPQNEKKYGHWEEQVGGGRRYWLEVMGRLGWRACYFKEVDAQDFRFAFGRRYTTIKANWSRSMRSSRWMRDTTKSSIEP